MKRIVDFFRNRTVISLIGLLALCLLIWFGGPHVKFGDENSAPLGSVLARLFVCTLIIMSWLMHFMWQQLKTRKQNAALVDDLESNQVAMQSNMSSDQARQEVKLINERFSQALETLKKLRFRGRGFKKALYELPWYIIIGPPGSGKTTALVNSSLDFPLAEQFGKGALQGVGGTRNCDWWFTNEAVLIDTAGRYTTQDSHKVVDSTAWEGFLGLLKRNRRRRPINGAIVAISLQDILSQTEDERIMHAKIIRSRIDELMEKLEIRFPVYLVFTKTDLVAGFSEFFEDLGKEDREQVWGISLPDAPADSQGPDFDYLEGQFAGLLRRVYDRVLWRVHQERDVRRRGKIQGFPLQMENLRPLLESFVRQTFVKNRYRYQPYLRGIYFSSGTQDGTSVDRLMSSVSANFGFSNEQMHSAPQQGKSFFLGNLFRNVIFPEQELVGANRKYERMMLWMQRGAYVAMAGLAVIMFTVWAGSFTRNEMFMREVQGYIAEYHVAQKHLGKWNADIRTVLPVLNSMAKASVVYDREDHPWLSGLGMYDSHVDESADRAYHNLLQSLFMPMLLDNLEKSLRQGYQGGDLYNTFRAYMMFSKTEHLNRELVESWFGEKWKKQLHGQATVRKELQAHLQALMQQELVPAELDRNIVNVTRQTLLRVPVSQRIYARLKSRQKYTDKVNLINEFGESAQRVFRQDVRSRLALETPFLFTKQAYDELELTEDSPLVRDIVNERWVLADGQQKNVDFVREDMHEISEKVKQHYLADYQAHWSKVLQTLDVVPFRDLRHANEVLASFTDPVYSPLLTVLQVARANTELTNPLVANLADDNQGGAKGKISGFAAQQVNYNRVDRHFRDLNKLLHESAKSPAPVNGIVQNLQMLHGFVNEISVAPEPSKKAFEIAKARYMSGSGNAITALRSYAKNTPEPVKKWLDAMADETWKVILQSAHHFVNSEWQTQVYSVYKRGLEGRYPLSRNAHDELALFDFAEFFKPQGVMDTFYNEYMKPFVDARRGWVNRSVDNISIGFSSTTIKQVRRAMEIKQIFFSDNPAMPGLSFQLRPNNMYKNDARFMLEIGEKRISYSHGPKFWKTLQWSGDGEHNRVRLIFEDLSERQHIRTYEGPWAWFRLQDDSSLKMTNKSNVYLATYKVAENDNSAAGAPVHEIRYEVKARSVNNPFGSNLLGSFRCPEKI